MSKQFKMVGFAWNIAMLVYQKLIKMKIKKNEKMGSKICHEPPSGEWKDMKCQSYTPEFISPKVWVELTIRKNINDKVKFCFSHNILLCSLSGLNIVCIDKVRGRSWNFGFCGFWGMSKIFDFKGVALWGYIS